MNFSKPLAFLWIVAGVFGDVGYARAYCLTTTVNECPECTAGSAPTLVGSGSPCDPYEDRPGSFSPAQRLHWRNRCISYALNRNGSKSLTEAEVRRGLVRAFSNWEGVRCGQASLGFQFYQLEAQTQCGHANYCAGENACSGRDCLFDGCRGSGNANVISFVDNGWECDSFEWENDCGTCSEKYTAQQIRDGACQGCIDCAKYTSGTLALTTAWYSNRTGQIYDADIEFNEVNYTFMVFPEQDCSRVDACYRSAPILGQHPDDEIGGSCSCLSVATGEPVEPTAPGVADFVAVATHEVGHFLGISHNALDRSATMYPDASSRDLRGRDLADDDIGALCALYSTSTSEDIGCTADSFMPRGGLSLQCDGLPALDNSGCDHHAGAVSSARSTAQWPWWVCVVICARRRQVRLKIASD